MKKFVDEHSSLQDKEDYPYLDNGDWLASAVKYFIEVDDPRYQMMSLWDTTPREMKAIGLLDTLFRAILHEDPISFTDWKSFGEETSFITRILALNQSKGLNLNLNVLDPESELTLLMYAIIQKLPHVVNQLCETKDVDPNIKDKGKRTALHYAALCGNEEIVKKLLGHGALINAKDSKGRTPPEMALQIILIDNKDRNPSDDIKVLTALIKAGGTLPPLALTDQDKFGQTALCIAAGCGDLEAVNVLIAYNKSKLGEEKSNSPLATFGLLAHEKEPEVDLVNQLDFTGSAPLHAALASGNVSVIQTLLENKADPNVENEAGEKPLPMAIAGEYPDIVKILLAHNAIPDETAMEILSTKLASGEPSEAMLQIQQLLQEHEGHTAIKNVRKSAHCFLPAPTCFVNHIRI